MNRVMDENEFYKEIRELDLSVAGACTALMLHTKAVVNPKHVITAFDRQGKLSEPLTAAFRLLFERMKSNDRQRA